VEDFPLPAGCWLNQARLPGASRLTVVGNIEGNPGRKFPGALDRPETERFLYYDGLVPAPDLLRCERIDGKSVVLRNRATFDLTRLFVVDRRVPGAVGFASVDGRAQPFRAGTARTIEPRPVAAGAWPAAAARPVRPAAGGPG